VTGEFSIMDYIKSFGVALIAVSFTYGGYQQTINFGEEVNEPRKTIPRGIFIGLMIIIVLYLRSVMPIIMLLGSKTLKHPGALPPLLPKKCLDLLAELQLPYYCLLPYWLM